MKRVAQVLTIPTSRFATTFLALASFPFAFAQQVADTAFNPPIENPAFAAGRGPVVAIDEAHFNFHTATGRYLPFAELLRRDGYSVRASTAHFTATTLNGVRILVIANALNERNGKGNWSLPTPSAFTDAEISAVKEWVKSGGSLLLIADHMPFPGANQALAAAFGFGFSNGYAQPAREPVPGRPSGSIDGRVVFSQANATLGNHAIVRGRNQAEHIAAVATFTGSAFQCPREATSLLIFRTGSISLEPAVAWKFDPETPRTDIGGWSQGAVAKLEKGRIAVFGEAAMFSAQLSGPQKSPMGMNAAAAKQNPQFLLNVIHWLSGLVD